MTWLDDLHGALPASDLPAGARLVLLILVWHANHEDGCNAWPSTSTIARHAGTSRATVFPHLQRLEADGWIERTGTGPRGVVKYAITPPRPVVDSDQSGETTGQRPVSDQSNIWTQPRPLPKNNNNNSSVGT